MSQSIYIPFNKPYVAPNAIKYVEEALCSDHHQGGGFYNKKAAGLVKEINGGGEVFLTSSCTQALEMSTILLDLKPGDEVIMPSYTFTSAATALVNFGVIPVFVDIEPTHLNIDPNRVREAITPKTRAISVVNYAGFACDFESLDSIAREFGLLKIEDNAHGFGAVSNGYRLGTWGDLSTLSFHATKNIQCGEGGALIVNKNEFVDRAHLLQEKGTNRRQFLLGNVEKYQWQDKGGSFLLSEVLSALLYSQLEQYENIRDTRDKHWETYRNCLTDLGITNVLNNFESKNQSSHIFAIMTNANERDLLIEALRQRNIESTSHYQPLHSSNAGLKYGKQSCTFVNSNNASKSILRLPLFFDLDENQISFICEAISEFNFG